jgi:hypothetical protein
MSEGATKIEAPQHSRPRSRLIQRWFDRSSSASGMTFTGAQHFLTDASRLRSVPIATACNTLRPARKARCA